MYSYCILTLLTLVITLLSSFFLLSYITVQANYTTKSSVLQIKYQFAASENTSLYIILKVKVTP